jgi:hypothetical protein
MRTAKVAAWFSAGVALSALVFFARADQIVMQNGDRYNGKVLSVSPTNIVLQSDVLGVVNLSRSKVANVAMGLAAATNATPVAQPAKTNAPTDLSAAVRQLGGQSNLVSQVRAQFLATASPEVNQKFDQMLGDLGSGKMSMADLRAEAKSAAAQLRALEKESGDDSSGTLGVYLSILDGFLAETESATAGVTNKAVQVKP